MKKVNQKTVGDLLLYLNTSKKSCTLEPAKIPNDRIDFEKAMVDKVVPVSLNGIKTFVRK